jgi:epsilon-lactone hydrolase
VFLGVAQWSRHHLGLSHKEPTAMLHLPARDIPVPTSVSPEAQAVLAMGRLGPPAQEMPALDDSDAWKAYVAETDGFVRSMVGDGVADFDGTIEDRVIGACPVYVVTPDGVADDDRR